MIRTLLFVALPLLAGVVWMGASCDRGDSNPPRTNRNANANGGADDGDGTTDINDFDAAGLTEEAKRDVMARIDRERKWWRRIQNPVKPQQRYDYMQRMLGSMKFFIDYGAWQLVSSPMRTQQQQRRREPVFLALSAHLGSQVPPPAGTPDSRRESIRMLEEAVAIDESFAHGWLLLGRVILVNEAAAAGGKPGEADVRRCARHIRKALALHEAFPEAHRYLAMTFAELGESRPAVEAARVAIDLGPTSKENWLNWLRILVGLSAFSEIEKAGDLIVALQPPPAVQYAAYGVLADHFARTEQYQKSWDAMQLALAAAMTDTAIIRRTADWVKLYSTIGRLAFFKPRPEVDRGFGYMREAADHAHRHKLPMVPVIIAWTQAMTALMANPPRGYDVQARLAELLELCFDALGNEALADVERKHISQVIAEFLGLADLGAIERDKLWYLLDWTVDQVGDGDEALFNLSIKMIQALMPIKDGGTGFPRINPDHLTDTDDKTLKGIVQVLTRIGLESTRFRISFPSAEWLGHLLTASVGRYDDVFVDKASDILGRASTRDQNTRKESVCRVLAIHPVESLAAAVISSLEKVVETGNTSACHSLFKHAHPALISIFGESEQPELTAEWAPESRTTLAQYEALLVSWKDRIR